LLSDLAHADFFVEGTRTWRALTPLIAGLAGNEQKALLIGARSPALLDRAHAAALTYACGIEVSGPRLGPCTVRLTGSRDAFRALSSAIDAPFIENYARELCRTAEPLADVLARTSPQTEPRRWLLRSLDFNSGVWTEDARSPGVREYRPRYGDPIFCVVDIDGALRALPKRDAVYAAAMQQGIRLIRYERAETRLMVPRVAPLPERLARIVALCSGCPALEARDVLVYEGVPHYIAAVVCAALGQPLPDVVWSSSGPGGSGRYGDG
jgi:hypothetical protein